MNGGIPHARLNLDQLIRDYIENLNVTLRGFKAVDGYDFLDTFVPSEDPTTSLRDLVDLSRDAGVGTLTVHVSAATLAAMDLAKLQSDVGRFDRQEANGATDLVFTLRAGVSADQLPIHPAYRTKLAEVLRHVAHEKPVPASPGPEVTAITHQGITLWAQVKHGRHVVVRAAFQGAADPVQRGLLEALCTAMEGKPLLECADHGMIHVERGLRDAAVPPPVAGTVTPDNADPAFAAPQAAVRALLAEYRQKTGYRETANFYDRPLTPRWMALNDEQRQQAVREVFARHGVAEELVLLGMDGHRRAVVRFAGSLDSHAKQAVLAKIDACLRQELEPGLQLVAQVKADTNVVRIEPKKS